MVSTQKLKGNTYEDIGAVAADCKNLATKFKCPVISASQLGRYSWNVKGDEVVTMAVIADSAQKAHLAHSVTTINANMAKKLSINVGYIWLTRNGYLRCRYLL